MQPLAVVAQSDYEFYFFGVNLDAYKNGNWLMIATGAATSLLAHELGHALYLESQGKNWNFAYSTSGLSVHTDDDLTDEQYRNFGRAGFAFKIRTVYQGKWDDPARYPPDFCLLDFCQSVKRNSR